MREEHDVRIGDTLTLAVDVRETPTEIGADPLEAFLEKDRSHLVIAAKINGDITGSCAAELGKTASQPG
jgi:hypothetical protein